MPLPINDLAEEEEHNNSANLKEVVEKCSLQESDFKGESELRKKWFWLIIIICIEIELGMGAVGRFKKPSRGRRVVLACRWMNMKKN